MGTSAFDLMKTVAKKFATAEVQHFIGGEWCGSSDKRKFELFDPASGTAFTKAYLGGKSEVDMAVSSARTLSGESASIVP